MTVDEFVAKYINKKVGSGQCVALFRQYLKEIYNTTSPLVVGAKDIWDKSPEGFEKIANAPSNIPSKGDIVIWGNGKYGHVAIALNCDVNVCRTFDQNFPTGSLCRKVSHKYVNVIGWLHKNNTKMTKLSKSVTISTKGELHPAIDCANMVAVGKIKIETKFPDGTPFSREYTPTKEIQVVTPEVDELKKKVNGLYGTINQEKKKNEKLEAEIKEISQIREKYEEARQIINNQKKTLSVYATEALKDDKRYKELSENHEALKLSSSLLEEQLAKETEEKEFWRVSFDNLVLDCKELEAMVARAEAWGSIMEAERDQMKDLIDLSGSKFSLIWKFILTLIKR